MLQSMFLWIINLIFHIYSNSCAVLDLRPTACLSRFPSSAPRQATRKVMTMHHFAWRGTILSRSRSRIRDSGTCLIWHSKPTMRFSLTLPVRKVSCIKRSLYENLMHACMEMKFAWKLKFWPKISWLKIPWMKLCTAQLPMKISGAGRNFHFHEWRFHFHTWKVHIFMYNEILCMKFHPTFFFLHETFRTGSNAEATFVQSTRTQIYLKTITPVMLVFIG